MCVVIRVCDCSVLQSESGEVIEECTRAVFWGDGSR